MDVDDGIGCEADPPCRHRATWVGTIDDSGSGANGVFLCDRHARQVLRHADAVDAPMTWERIRDLPTP